MSRKETLHTTKEIESKRRKNAALLLATAAFAGFAGHQFEKTHGHYGYDPSRNPAPINDQQRHAGLNPNLIQRG